MRGVPICFVGLSTEFIYVDEFEQSPEEFFMHDCNHSWRMIQEDVLNLEKMQLSREQYFKTQSDFIQEYLATIKISKHDSEIEKEIKKLKKIILFEIVHEDARPFMKDVICEYIQQVEGVCTVRGSTYRQKDKIYGCGRYT